jgi:hypothetical protein
MLQLETGGVKANWWEIFFKYPPDLICWRHIPVDIRSLEQYWDPVRFWARSGSDLTAIRILPSMYTLFIQKINYFVLESVEIDRFFNIQIVMNCWIRIRISNTGLETCDQRCQTFVSMSVYPATAQGVSLDKKMYHILFCGHLILIVYFPLQVKNKPHGR